MSPISLQDYPADHEGVLTDGILQFKKAALLSLDLLSIFREAPRALMLSSFVALRLLSVGTPRCSSRTFLSGGLVSRTAARVSSASSMTLVVAAKKIKAARFS